MDIKVQKEVNEVTKGIVIYAILVSVIAFLLSKQTISIVLGVVFGSIIAILNFRLLALTMEKSIDLPPSKAQVYTASRYSIRMFIVAAVVFVSVKNPNINVLGTILGLVSTQIVIFVNKLFITKITRKGV
ncbi:MAG: ATP synthase subunit I [Terrisporobacter sp.]|uniref:ATP synthase subunit I n=1 Tax=Terrisporobacter sp. TaxID=1965305 RepID=UPI002FC9B689